MKAVFSDGSTRTLDSMQQSFYRELASLRRMVVDEQTKRKYISAERGSLERTFASLGRLGLFAGIALAFFGFTNVQEQRGGAVGDFALNILLFGVGLVVNGLVLRYLAGKISLYTQKGVEARAKTAAFRKFIEDREKFRELGYTGENFEKYLPYAIAFGMDREWLQRFQNVQNVAPPVWYVPVFVDTTPYANSDGDASDLTGVFTGSDERGGSSGSSSPNISLDSMSTNIGVGLGAISMGMGNFLNTAASAMTSAPTPVVTSSSFSDSGSSWSGSSGSDSGGWSSGDSGGGWSGGGDSGGDSDFG